MCIVMGNRILKRIIKVVNKLKHHLSPINLTFWPCYFRLILYYTNTYFHKVFCLIGPCLKARAWPFWHFCLCGIETGRKHAEKGMICSKGRNGDVQITCIFDCRPVMTSKTLNRPAKPWALIRCVFVGGMHLSHKALLCNYQDFSWWSIRLASWPNCTTQGIRNNKTEWSNCRQKTGGAGRQRDGLHQSIYSVYPALTSSATTIALKGCTSYNDDAQRGTFSMYSKFKN